MSNYNAQRGQQAKNSNRVWIDGNEIEIEERVVKMARITKVVKGGRRFSFNALTVVGDSNSYVGVGFGKAQEIPEAIRKSIEDGKVKMIKIKKQGTTIPHEVIGKYKSARVLLKPCSLGTGVIAGEAVRAVIELAGIQDVLTKRFGSSNALNIVKATVNALEQIISPDDAKRMRSLTLREVFGKYSIQRRNEKKILLEKQKKIQSDDLLNKKGLSDKKEGLSNNKEVISNKKEDLSNNKKVISDKKEGLSNNKEAPIAGVES